MKIDAERHVKRFMQTVRLSRYIPLETTQILNSIYL